MNKACVVCGKFHPEDEDSHDFAYVLSFEEIDERCLIDQISYVPLFEAVVAPCGHTFSRATLVKALQQRKQCPNNCPGELNIKDASVNYLAKTQSDKLLVSLPSNFYFVLRSSLCIQYVQMYIYVYYHTYIHLCIHTYTP